ncbi:MAG: DsbE family thiol:disulfide interchange protein [Kordiimonadaceae bacterium]|nr:DsbE family thiol:disulfide interchange protein [Kordiimonadaceae bacterium]
MTGFKRFIPLVIVLLLGAVFFKSMTDGHNPKEIKSVRIDKPAPTFSLPLLADENKQATEAILKTGKPVLVNFFASWCAPCRAEHESLMTLAFDKGIPIIGIAYKDDPAKSQRFLDSLGNPFSQVVVDRAGRAGIDWGVTGVPETFLIDGAGIVRYRHWGPIVGEDAVDRVMAAVEGLE